MGNTGHYSRILVDNPESGGSKPLELPLKPFAKNEDILYINHVFLKKHP